MKPLGPADPTVIASYRLLGVLGSGGMGRVYLAQSATGRRLAIKVIRTDLAEDPTFRRRFAHEVAAVRAVNPLFTAAVVDADVDAAAPWLATTYIEGPSLEQWVADHGLLDPAAVLILAAGLAEALASIHRAGLVHRDLKPANVLLDDSGPHIIDFGIALAPESTRMTTSLVGTPSYMSPELLRGAEAAPASDIFSLGATLFFASTGRRLVDGGSVYEQVMKITAGRFDLSTVPAQVRPIVARCLSRRARDRPRADELTRLLSAPGIRAPQPDWYRPGDPAHPATAEPATVRLSRRRFVALGGVLGLAAVGTGAGAAGVLFAGLSNSPAEATVGLPRGVSNPATVLWQLGTGAIPASPGSDSRDPRIVVDPAGLVIASNAPQVFALDTRGRRQWARTLSGGPLGGRLWGDAVLVSDDRRVWLLDTATGEQRFALDLAGAQEAMHDTGAGDVAIRQVTLSTDLAYLDVGAAVIALDRAGRTVWRRPPPAPPPTSPQAAGAVPATGLTVDHTRLVTQSRTGSTVLAGLDDPASGAARWSTRYTLPAMPSHRPPPDGGPPDGGPPDGAGNGGTQPAAPPDLPLGGPHDADWDRSEARLGPGLVALRDAQAIRVLHSADGTLAWQRTSVAPVAGMEIVGDRLVVAADRLTAYALATGEQAWQVPLRGARLAAASDGQATVAATTDKIYVIDRGGVVRWRADLPATVNDAIPDQLTTADGVAYLIFSARGPRQQPLDVDVLALDLRHAGG